MYTVKTPNGRTYTFGPRRAADAAALARRTGGTVRTVRTDDPYGIRAEREVDAQRENRTRYGIR